MKHRSLSEEPTDETGEATDEDVAGAVVGGVAAEPLGEIGVPDKTQRDGRHSRSE